MKGFGRIYTNLYIDCLRRLEGDILEDWEKNMCRRDVWIYLWELV